MSKIGQRKDGFAQNHDNVTEWDIGLRCWWLGLPVDSDTMLPLDKVFTHPTVQAYVKSGETVGKWIQNINKSSKN